MSVLERFLREAPQKLAAKDHQAVLEMIERLAKAQAPGIRARYLWGAALLAAAQAEKEAPPIEDYARRALEQFALVVRGNIEAGRDPRHWLRLESSVEVDCYHRTAEALRLLATVANSRSGHALAAGKKQEAHEFRQDADGFAAQAERWAEKAQGVALGDLSAGLTKHEFLPGSDQVGPGASRHTPITESSFADATLPIVRELDAVHTKAAKALEAILNDEITDRPFASREAQQAVVLLLRELLTRMERRLHCPVCDEPAMPMFTKGKTEGLGQIQYRHHAASIEGAHGGGQLLPKKLRLTAPGADKRRKSHG